MDLLKEAKSHKNGGDKDHDSYEACKAKEIGYDCQAKHYVIEISDHVRLYCRKFLYFFDIDLHHLHKLTTSHIFV